MSNDFKSSDEYAKIFSFHETIANRIISQKSSWLEFKESFNWNSKDKYAKSMVAFGNNKGGFIIFGVRDKMKHIIS